MKICVYTCITGNYDKLQSFGKQDSNIDFICFTDNPTIHSNDWIIKPIPRDLSYLSPVKQQRIVKILPHKYLHDYDVSVWVDGNIKIMCDIMQFINGLDLEAYHFYTRKHPSRTCTYKEAVAVLDMKKGNPSEINRQMNRYRNEGLPENNGMCETCIIIRVHNNRNCMLLDNLWATELIQNSHRDQLSFNYCLWKLNMEIGYFDIGKLSTNNEFRWSKHG